MREVQIRLENIDKVKNFVSAVSEFNEELDIIRERYVINAKSILGIFSLDLSKPLHFRVHAGEERAEEILEAVKEYIIEFE